MAEVRLDLDPRTYRRLIKRAVSERRPINWQAEVLLRQALAESPPEPTNAVRRSEATDGR